MFEDVQSWVGDDDDDDEAAKADELQDSKADNELMPVDGNAEELFKSEDEHSHDEVTILPFWSHVKLPNAGPPMRIIIKLSSTSTPQQHLFPLNPMLKTNELYPAIAERKIRSFCIWSDLLAPLRFVLW